jgi:hypothetical protein
MSAAFSSLAAGIRGKREGVVGPRRSDPNRRFEALLETYVTLVERLAKADAARRDEMARLANDHGNTLGLTSSTFPRPLVRSRDALATHLRIVRDALLAPHMVKPAFPSSDAQFLAESLEVALPRLLESTRVEKPLASLLAETKVRASALASLEHRLPTDAVGWDRPDEFLRRGRLLVLLAATLLGLGVVGVSVGSWSFGVLGFLSVSLALTSFVSALLEFARARTLREARPMLVELGEHSRFLLKARYTLNDAHDRLVSAVAAHDAVVEAGQALTRWASSAEGVEFAVLCSAWFGGAGPSLTGWLIPSTLVDELFGSR